MFKLGKPAPESLQTTAYAWYCETASIDRDQLEDCLNLLSEDEQRRHARLLSMPDADSYAISHALLHQALSLFSDTRPGDWQFTRNDNGKPFIRPELNPQGLYYSLSHCKTACAIMIADVEHCGIDIENTSREGNYLELARKMFSPAEISELEQSTDTRQDFFHIWTMREACVKAMGTGLANSRDFFSLQCDTENIRYLDNHLNRIDDSWQLRYFEDGDHATALAIRSDQTRKIELAKIV